MGKLYFRHGAMNSAKTLNLLAVRHNYLSQGKQVCVIKSAIDDRWGPDDRILSRAGLEASADFIVAPEQTILYHEQAPTWSDMHCVLVDEAQFLHPHQVEELREITRLHGVPVICYGLRTDFRTKAFPGSRRLFELADSVEEVKTTCFFCNKKAIFNLRYETETDLAVLAGPQIQTGADDVYHPVCYPCYARRVLHAVKPRGVHHRHPSPDESPFGFLDAALK